MKYRQEVCGSDFVEDIKFNFERLVCFDSICFSSFCFNRVLLLVFLKYSFDLMCVFLQPEYPDKVVQKAGIFYLTKSSKRLCYNT